MANTYTQIYIQIVFAVEGRQNLIDPKHNDDLQKYITGIVKKQRQTLIALNNMPDHVHLLIGQRPDSALSDLVGDIKSGSTNFINRHRWVKGRFNWQEGFGGFLVFSFAVGHSNSLCSESAETSPEAFVS